jgi:hypothetical protein
VAKTTQQSDETPAVPGATPEQVNAAIVALAKAAENEGPRRVRHSRARFRTPWNPEGKKRRPTLARTTRLNGFRLKEATLSEEEILLLNRLQPGKYRGGEWIVTETDGEGTAGKALDVYIPNKSQQDRLKRAQIAGTRGLAGLLDLMVQEAAA